MEDNKKDGYVAGTIFLLFGIVTLISAFHEGIFGAGEVTGIVGLFFSAIGGLSLAFPKVAEVLVHWARKQQQGENYNVSQKQHKPTNSPQTGILKGNQYIHYDIEKKEKSTKKSSYNKNKIKKRLLEIKTELNNLIKLNNGEGSKIFSPLKTEVRGIIHKIYSNNPEASEKRLIHKVFWMISSSTKEEDYQKWYIEDVEGLISTIEIILREMELE
jgi:hypothetical protein